MVEEEEVDLQEAAEAVLEEGLGAAEALLGVASAEEAVVVGVEEDTNFAKYGPPMSSFVSTRGSDPSTAPPVFYSASIDSKIPPCLLVTLQLSNEMLIEASLQKRSVRFLPEDCTGQWTLNFVGGCNTCEVHCSIEFSTVHI